MISGRSHPAAKKKRERIAFHTGRPLLIGVAEQEAEPTKEASGVPLCPRCEKPMKRVKKLERDSELSVLGDILAARGPPLSLDLRCNGA
jgi:hypothetical protein